MGEIIAGSDAPCASRLGDPAWACGFEEPRETALALSGAATPSFKALLRRHAFFMYLFRHVWHSPQRLVVRDTAPRGAATAEAPLPAAPPPAQPFPFGGPPLPPLPPPLAFFRPALLLPSPHAPSTPSVTPSCTCPISPQAPRPPCPSAASACCRWLGEGELRGRALFPCNPGRESKVNCWWWCGCGSEPGVPLHCTLQVWLRLG